MKNLILYRNCVQVRYWVSIGKLRYHSVPCIQYHTITITNSSQDQNFKMTILILLQRQSTVVEFQRQTIQFEPIAEVLGRTKPCVRSSTRPQPKEYKKWWSRLWKLAPKPTVQIICEIMCSRSNYWKRQNQEQSF